MNRPEIRFASGNPAQTGRNCIGSRRPGSTLYSLATSRNGLKLISALNGWLVAHKSSKQEIANLLGIVARDLKDSQAKNVSDDWRFAIAYNAALQAATAALAASGYRAGRDGHHYRVIQSLELTVGKDSKFIGAAPAVKVAPVVCRPGLCRDRLQTTSIHFSRT
jgi:hypothetical protein